jgi:peptidoglycan/LPS O-acetylase OafA/YrhL
LESTSSASLPYVPAAFERNAAVSKENFNTKSAIFDHVPTLDGWRALSIIGVICYHSSSLISGPSSVLSRMSDRGRFGVDLFFAISGFLICGRLLQELQNSGKVSLSNFYWKRCFRILPAVCAYLLILAVLTGLGWTGTHEWEFSSTILFVRNYLPLYHDGVIFGAYTAQFWSLAVEEHFYLLWPVIMLAAARNMRRLPTVTILAALSIFLWRTIDSAHGWLIPFGSGIDSKTDTRLDALLWGSLAAFAFPFLHRKAQQMSSLRWAWLIIAPLCVVVMFFQYMPGADLFRAVLFAALVASTALSSTSLLGSFLELPVLQWIGRLSYSLYIWQQLFLFPTHMARSPLHFLQEVPYNFGAILIAGVLSYYLVERPMIRFGRRMLAHFQDPARTPYANVIRSADPARSFAR